MCYTIYMEDQLNKFIQVTAGRSNLGDTPQNKGQCVGLIELWTDLLNLPHTWGNAIDLIKDADPNSFEIVYNKIGDTTQFPPDGAVAVLGKPYGLLLDGTYAGHTGVSKGSDGNTLRLWEQNDPQGSTPQLKEYSYDSCIGWIIPKVSTSISALPANYDTIIQKATQWDTTCTELSLGDPNTTLYDKLASVIAGYKSIPSTWQTKLNQAAQDLALAQQDAKNKDDEISSLEQQATINENLLKAGINKLNLNLLNEQNLITKYKATVVQLQGTIKAQNDTIAGLKKELAGSNAPAIKLSLWQSIVNLFRRG